MQVSTWHLKLLFVYERNYFWYLFFLLAVPTMQIYHFRRRGWWWRRQRILGWSAVSSFVRRTSPPPLVGGCVWPPGVFTSSAPQPLTTIPWHSPSFSLCRGEREMVASFSKCFRIHNLYMKDHFQTTKTWVPYTVPVCPPSPAEERPTRHMEN